MRVGLAGGGFVACNYHIPSLQMTNSVELIALCEENPKTLRRVGDQFGIRDRFGLFETMLEESDIDMVDIATPGYTHYELCKRAIEHGVDVLVEKPIALSSRDAEELSERSRKRGVNLCVIQNYRYRDGTLRFLELTRAGKIGSINSMITQHHGASIFGQPRWMWDERLSGGVLYENAVHSVDLHTFLLGPHIKVFNVDHSYDPRLKLTTAVRVLTEHQSGAVGFLDLAWFGSSIFFRSDISASITDATLKLQPDELVLRSGETGPWSETVGDLKRLLHFGKDVATRQFRRRSILPHYRIISGFVRSILSGDAPPVRVEDVLPAMKLLDQIKERIQIA